MYKRHYLSSCFPDLDPESLKELRESITKIGIQEPVRLYQGEILDGWHRYTIATELGLDCPAFELDKDIDATDFVKSTMARRSMTQSQKAVSIVKISEWRTAGNKHGPQDHVAKTNAEMAKAAGVGTKAIGRAKNVEKKGTDAVKDAVKSGKIGLSKASAIVELPKDQQAAAIDKPLPKKEKPKKTTPKKKEVVPDYDERDDLNDKIRHLHEEVEQLKVELALKFMPENRESAQEIIDSQKKQIQDLAVELDAVKQSRNTLMVENSELKKQCASYQRQLKKVNNGKAS